MYFTHRALSEFSSMKWLVMPVKLVHCSIVIQHRIEKFIDGVQNASQNIIPQNVQCILQGLSSVFLCVPFIFADSENCWFDGRTCFLCIIKVFLNFLSNLIILESYFTKETASAVCFSAVLWIHKNIHHTL